VIFYTAVTELLLVGEEARMKKFGFFAVVVALFFSPQLFGDDKPSPNSAEAAIAFMEGADCHYLYSKNKSTVIDSDPETHTSLNYCLNQSVCTKGRETVRATLLCSMEKGKCPEPLACVRNLGADKAIAVKRGGGVLSDEDENFFSLNDKGEKVDEYGRVLKMVSHHPAAFRMKLPNGKFLKFCALAVMSTGGEPNAPYLPPMIACTLKSEVTKDGKTTAYCPGVYECAKKRYTTDSVDVAGLLNPGDQALAFSERRRPGLRNQSDANSEVHYQ